MNAIKQNPKSKAPKFFASEIKKGCLVVAIFQDSDKRPINDERLPPMTAWNMVHLINTSKNRKE